MSFMDKSLEDGGATWNMTIYQIVYESSSNALFLKRKIEDKEWQYIDLDSMFKGILTDSLQIYDL